MFDECEREQTSASYLIIARRVLNAGFVYNFNELSTFVTRLYKVSFHALRCIKCLASSASRGWLFVAFVKRLHINNMISVCNFIISDVRIPQARIISIL